jgi:hypothetical protein
LTELCTQYFRFYNLDLSDKLYCTFKRKVLLAEGTKIGNVALVIDVRRGPSKHDRVSNTGLV